MHFKSMQKYFFLNNSAVDYYDVWFMGEDSSWDPDEDSISGIGLLRAFKNYIQNENFVSIQARNSIHL